MTDEADRVRQAYARRDTRGGSAYFGFEGPAHVARVQERQAHTLQLLARHGLQPLSGLRILDIGCGDGDLLRRLQEWGADPVKLAGIDLRPDAIARGTRLAPGLDLRVASGDALPWADGAFDLVCQHTMFTSVLDAGIRQAIAAEMRRVVSPSGAVLWYDFRYNNPRNPDVRGIRRAEIGALFPGFSVHLAGITLAPPIARRIPRALLPVVYPLLSALPFLRTHYLGLLRRHPASSI